MANRQTDRSMAAPSSERTRPVPWWQWPNLLSLDAPLVALSWLVLFKSAYWIFALPDTVYGLLFVAVWGIYVLDRLLDSSPVLDLPRSNELRHRFHHRHRRWLTPLAIGGMLWVGWTGATTLPATLVLCSGYLVLLVLLYYAHRILLARQPVPILPRELFCGVVFAIGCGLAPRVYSGRIDYPFDDALAVFLEHPMIGLLGRGDPLSQGDTPSLVWGGVQFLGQSLIPDLVPVVILFTLNCVAIAAWEHRPQGPNDPSAITTIEPRLVHWLGPMLLGLAAITALAALLWGHADTTPTYLAVVLAALGLWAVNRWRARFSRGALRALADACLLTPWLVIPFLHPALRPWIAGLR